MIRMKATPVHGNLDMPQLAATLDMTDDCPADALGQCLAEAMHNALGLGLMRAATTTYIIQFEQL